MTMFIEGAAGEQKIQPTAPANDGAGKPAAHAETPTPVRTKRQMVTPGLQQYDRVQSIMEKDLALRRYLGPKTHEAIKRNGKKIKFSPEAVKVAEAFYDENLDAAKMPHRAILIMAKNVLMPNGSPPLPTTSQPATPDAALIKLAKVEPPGTGGHDKTAHTESRYGKTTPTAALPDRGSEKSVQVEVVPSNIPIVLPEKLEDFAAEIRQRVERQAGQFVADTIAIGAAFMAAVEKYDRSLKELAAETGLSYGTVTQYVKIGERFGCKQKSWAPAQLPPSVDSLMRLARLKPDQLDSAIEAGKVSASMGRGDVKALLAEYRPAKPKPSRKASAGDAADQSASAGLKEVKGRSTALQEAVEDCQRQFPAYTKDLILVLEDHLAWVENHIKQLRRGTSEGQK